MKTDSDGNYRYGPVEIKEYLAFAHKEDFIFEKKEGNLFDFKSSQLAKLEVNVIDRKTKKSLEGVFLSLSAGKKRITGMTGKGGVFKFGMLEAQKFYLTAILKEFTFNFIGDSVDQDGAVTIKDGEHISIQIEATRIAFSANGKIQTLGGKPVN